MIRFNDRSQVYCRWASCVRVSINRDSLPHWHLTCPILKVLADFYHSNVRCNYASSCMSTHSLPIMTWSHGESCLFMRNFGSDVELSQKPEANLNQVWFKTKKLWSCSLVLFPVLGTLECISDISCCIIKNVRKAKRGKKQQGWCWYLE